MLNAHSFISSNLVDTSEDVELRQRLGLYQVFLKLYEHHQSLLDEILSLENSSSKSLSGVILPYVQGVVQDRQTYLVTNLLQGKTQALSQPQMIWTIGRDSHQSILPIQDRRLSRCHAAIRYIAGQGFFLIDLESSNGSFVNGERVRQMTQLRDGDRVRLGSVTFAFFICQVSKTAPELSPTLLEELNRLTSSALSERTEAERTGDCTQPVATEQINGSSSPTGFAEETVMFMQSELASDGATSKRAD